VVVLGEASGSIASPGSASVGAGVLLRLNIAWNTGLCDSVRSGCSASTTCSNGTSAWA
jgi:hypothetical protein